MLRISNKGLDLVKEYEGYRSESYKDPVGVWTIGYGTTKGVVENLRITKPLAEMLLAYDVQEYENYINEYVKVPLIQNQFDALVSFVYNLGPTNFQRSTLLEQLNKGEYDRAANEFLKWVYAGGHRLAGLIRRREAERSLFLGEL